MARDNSLGLFIKEANIGESYERFTALREVEIKLRIQHGIIINSEIESLIGKFAFSLFGRDHSYFLNNDMQMSLNGMGAYGESIKDIKFHDNIQYLKEFSKMRSGAGPIDYFSIYVLERHKDGLCLSEILRWNTDTKSNFKDRIIYIDEAHVNLPF